MQRSLFLAIWIGLISMAAYSEAPDDDRPLREFIAAHVEKLEPLALASNLAYWKASTTGRDADYKEYDRLQVQIHTLYNDPDSFAFLKEWKETRIVQDGILRRQMELLYLFFLRDQIEPDLMKQIVDLDAKIQKKYNTFRGEMEGKKVTNSDVYRILTTEKDSHIRELAWRASKQVGDAIAGDLIQLVKLRNRAARSLGFENFHTFTIETGEQNVDDLNDIFQTLDDLTRQPFAEMKKELDEILAKGFDVDPSNLAPWHYHDPFFQRTPQVYELDLDPYYKKFDVKKLAERFYAGVGLPVDEILAKSDLYDREGKNPHAFSQDIDRKGDVRILANLNNDERWMETILHELGHAIYDKNHDMSLPFLLREPAHSFTTEAIAMLFGRLSRNAVWMRSTLNLPDGQYAALAEAARKYTRCQQILFVRWALVMFNFEKQLYADPDQKLNDLWWNLVKNYQLLNPPSGPHGADWAAKLHFTIAPCYYHNYMLGELLASQLHATIVRDVFKRTTDAHMTYVNNRAIGDFLRENVFAPGTRYRWDEMIERATGEPLDPKYFIAQFLQ